ncbi:signal peptidase II [Polycladidibacter stylochi]|uniref:signal peptidase II n=1 Tax=Polycladidibacter stylochi TaxID=1807766 RepID=UPI000A82BFDE|nr:signal peptidase II [Pseudovibrio stylochi]
MLKLKKLWGAHSPVVAKLAIIGLIIDQAIKIWLVHAYNMAENAPISLAPFLDIVLVWNKGVSYGLFQQDSAFGQWALVGFTILASIAIWVWSAKSDNRFEAWCLGIILGGALGNGVDRAVYGQVVDYIHFHVGNFSWYVFNAADVWIVLGAAGLIFESLIIGKTKKT